MDFFIRISYLPSSDFGLDARKQENRARTIALACLLFRQAFKTRSGMPDTFPQLICRLEATRPPMIRQGPRE
jgi:hypothetical protein